MIAAAVNRWISYALLGIGVALIAFGVYMGLFAWANDGLIAGVRLFGTSAAFGAGLAITGLAFRFAAEAHAKSGPKRWWIQVLVLVIGYVAFGLAAWSSSFLDRIERSRATSAQQQSNLRFIRAHARADRGLASAHSERVMWPS